MTLEHCMSPTSTAAYCQNIQIVHSVYANLRVMQYGNKQQAVRVATLYAPAPLLPSGRQSASCTAKQTQRSSNFLRRIRSYADRCSRTSYALRPRWVKRPGDLDVWPFDLESGVRVTCDVGYICANFGPPWPLRSRLRPDVREDRQTSDVRQKHR